MTDALAQLDLAHMAPDLRPLARPLAALKEDPKNARRHSDENLAAIEASLKAHGQRKPIVVKDGAVLAGNGTLRVARRLGWTHLAAVEYEGPGAMARAFAIADNRAGELAEWDGELLAAALKELDAAGLLEATAFEKDAADEAVADALGEAGGDVDDPGAEEPPAVPVSKRGELYQLGPHRVLGGDSTNADDVRRLMGDERAALCATDPPYLVDYDAQNHPQSFANANRKRNKTWDAYKDPESGVEFYASFLRVAIEHALQGEVAFYQWHASRRQALVEQAWIENGLLVHQQLIWAKAHPILTRSHFMWQHEPCFYGWIEGKPPRKKPPAGGDASTVWQIGQAGEQDGIHPTQKPLAIFERPIGWHTEVGNVVYEPFLGSGSQLIAAARLGRRCYGLEIEPSYVDAIRKRWTRWARAAGQDAGPGALE